MDKEALIVVSSLLVCFMENGCVITETKRWHNGDETNCYDVLVVNKCKEKIKR